MARETEHIGIDISEHEIRAVQLRTRNGKPAVVKAAWVPIPENAFQDGRVKHIGALSLALKRLLESSGFGRATSRAVLSVSSDRLAIRNIAIPPVPDSELAAVVAGEVEHFGLLQSKGGAFGFIRLLPPNRTASTGSQQVTVMAVDDELTSQLREVAERANVEVVALEPSALSMLRTVAAATPAGGTAFTLIVGREFTDAIFWIDGGLAAYRRLDVGSIMMMPVVRHREAVVADSAATAVSDPLEGLHEGAVDRLALETRRTIEYLQREFADFAVLDRIQLITDFQPMEPLARVLSRQFGIETSLVMVPTSQQDSSTAQAEMSGVGGIRYSTAYGLALYNAMMPGSKVPKLDLFSTQRTAQVYEATKRNFAGSIVVSALGIALGILGFVMYNMQISRVEGVIGSTNAQTAAIEAQIDQTMEERALHTRQYRALRKEGVPIGAMMDYIVGSLQSGVGLKSVTVGSDLKVVISGEAVDEASVIKTTQNLQRSPVLKGLMINSFSRIENQVGNGIQFQLSGQTVSMDRIKMPKEANR
ncbi:MAG: pilus assembly protein PilM [Armatimonadetes bacterium]|nr:pilus assembly protein PilM [Armatimonadota bacterium]